MENLHKTKRFKRFHFVFWALAGFALFISGFSQSNFMVSLTRNAYLMLAGGFVTLLLVAGWQKLEWQRVKTSWLLFLATTYFFGTLLILPINPVTYAQIGLDFDDITWRHIFAGSMNYSMVLVFWGVCLIFLFKTGFHLPGGRESPLLGPVKGKTPTSPKGLGVEAKEGAKLIPFTEICYLKGAADYVEVHLLDGTTFLKKATIKSLLDFLGPKGFFQVHRSLVINRAALSGFEGQSKGAFTLVMKNGVRLQTSRGFTPLVHRLLEGDEKGSLKTP